MLHFSEGSIGEWISGDSIHDPEDETRFSLHDCIAVPGLWQPSRVPGDQKPGGADFGLLGSQGEVLGGAGGKLDLRNKDTDMREILEALQAILPAMNLSLTNLNAYGAAYGTQATKISSVLTKIKGLLA